MVSICYFAVWDCEPYLEGICRGHEVIKEPLLQSEELVMREVLRTVVIARDGRLGR